MPLWTIYHPASTFTDPEEKASLSKAITAIYTAVPLPAFYVNVLFVPLEPTNIYVGGIARPSPHSESHNPGPESSTPFIRITIQNIARKIPDPSTATRFLNAIDKALKPFIEDKGFDWEYSVEETSRDLWKVQGLVPPMPGTKAEKLWEVENRAVPFELADGGLDGPKL